MSSLDHATVMDLNRRDGWNGFFRVGVYRFQHELLSGEMGPALQREVFERGHAAAVLPWDPVRDEVLLIRQFLIGAHLAGLANRPLQVVAGMIETGESGAEVARREAVEEAGCTIGELIPAQPFLSSPGGSSERIETFLAVTDLTDAGGRFGLAEENEDIEAVVMPADEAIARLDAGEIEAAPAVVLLSWFARHHDRLKALYARD
ncbi:NUDIX domain-containing protein [Cereibacter sphaeroides]|uniref:NUDIX domain-containing protein n=1 Tax=Cereibacter sphaeroides TaxID=1063 RepID=UPI001F16716A|nr:NUDIX domain-containing protein [Cereibacter sphaeroides]MCE6957914.1 NUDIX domain-containing protein [Cereibacter sphaeroides]MCE6971738.1 NUDIX domain-containing protein [Cereibacter sphaeroides]